MKRSQINRLMAQAVAFCREMNFHLPPFAFWTPEHWKTVGHEYDEIRQNMLGWDITDYGTGDFDRVGLLLFTLRNGNLKWPERKPYAEKLLLVQEEQITPMHFHFQKTEDIINRGGGVLLVQVYDSTPEEGLSDKPVMVQQDGRHYEVPAGTIVRLTPGESITLPARQYHKFWGEKGKGMVLVGEVSRLNDDTCDNRFLEPVGRFPAIEEDEPPLYLMCNEYPPAP